MSEIGAVSAAIAIAPYATQLDRAQALLNGDDFVELTGQAELREDADATAVALYAPEVWMNVS